MRIEDAYRPSPELRPTSSVIASNVTFADFQARKTRLEIVTISGHYPEKVPQLNQLSKKPEKDRIYSPRKELLKTLSGVDRIKRWFRRGSGRSCRRLPHPEGKCPRDPAYCRIEGAGINRSAQKSSSRRETRVGVLLNFRLIPKPRENKHKGTVNQETKQAA